MTTDSLDFTVPRLGNCRINSPLKGVRFTDDSARISYHTIVDDLERLMRDGRELPSFEIAGPREKIFHDPSGLHCGIVTCGGLCPGLNDVIRSVVMSLYYHYGVRKVFGFRYGYEGLIRPMRDQPMLLTPESVNRINEMGGTILGSSRGPQDPSAMVDTLQELGIRILFTIGGDGTLKGASIIAEEALRRGLTISVIGIPKTIDNDISYVQTTFGFETAVAEARRATHAANSEADAARNGIGLVKLMGRDSGFIASFTVLVDSQVNFCLVPEVPFSLGTFLSALTDRLAKRGHALIVVAEGAGQDLMRPGAEHDASGNIKFGDIGVFLRDAIKDHFERCKIEATIKYIDPSYTIRSVPANAHDSAFCLLLGQSAVHAGMAGRTNMVVGFWNHQFTHVPICLATSGRKKVDPDGALWSAVLASTGQPPDMR
jgi:6-phosphofructokinase 1